MKNLIISLCLGLAALACAGCQTDDYARSVVCYNTELGKTLDLVAPSTLLQFSKIDLERTVNVPDGTPISVYIIKAKLDKGKPPAGTVVILHGLAECKTQFPYLGAGQVLARRGFDAVLIDLRTHGRSGGKYITYGVKEKQDVKAVMDALIADKTVDDKIYVFGATLGASVAIQYAAIDGRCRGVIAMTPYQDMATFARHMMPLTMSKEDFDKVLARAGEMAGINPADASCVLAVKNVKCPLLLIHGLIDLLVPYENSQAIFEAANDPKKLLVITPGPERLALASVLEDWIADKVELVAQGKVLQATVQSPPAEAPQKTDTPARPVKAASQPTTPAKSL